MNLRKDHSRVMRHFFAVNLPWALASGCASSLLEPGRDSRTIDGEDGYICSDFSQDDDRSSDLAGHLSGLQRLVPIPSKFATSALSKSWCTLSALLSLLSFSLI